MAARWRGGVPTLVRIFLWRRGVRRVERWRLHFRREFKTFREVRWLAISRRSSLGREVSLGSHLYGGSSGGVFGVCWDIFLGVED